MKQLTCAIALFLAAQFTHAQDNCNCLLNLNNFVEKVSNNYAGYADKVNSKTKDGYFLMVDSLKKRAEIATDLRTCYNVLEKYRSFFYDKHLQLGADLPADTTNNVAEKPTQTAWNKATVLAYFNKNQAKLKDIEGIWTTDGYEVGVVLNEKTSRFEGVVLAAKNKNFTEGSLKFSSSWLGSGRYPSEYVNGQLKRENIELTVVKNAMEVGNYGIWTKQFPATKDTLTFSQKTERLGEVQWRMLDKNTLYIRLKSCNLANKPVLDSLIKLNKEKLKTIPNWVVDFRGNSGGATDVFKELLPYLYTKPLIQRGNKHWLTPENTALLKTFYKENESVMDAESKAGLLKFFEFEKNNPNGWHDEGSDTTKYDKVLKFPNRVAVLSDKNNGSSGETFLIDARGMSDKVTIFGENSAGYLDYGDIMPNRLLCDKFDIAIPSRRANYLDYGETYDKTGYPPDVYIPETNKDWLKFVFDYWKKGKK